MIEALLVRPFKESDLARFSDLPGYRFSCREEPEEKDLAGTEVILGQPRFRQMAAAPHLKWLQITSAGADHYLSQRERLPAGLTITNLSGAFGRSISEFALTMCLMLYKQMHLYRDNQNARLWRDEGRQESPAGKELLILGAGNIGTETAKLFAPFGCRITGMRRTKGILPPCFDAMIGPEELDDALPRADIIVCALPGTPETYHLLDARRLALMKPAAILINVGRGSLIDGEALAERLNAGLLRGAALDVTEPEPLPPEHPLWGCRNAILTPHITGGTFGHLTATEEATFSICRENLMRYAEGRPLLNIVDPDTGYRRTEDRFE